MRESSPADPSGDELSRETTRPQGGDAQLTRLARLAVQAAGCRLAVISDQTRLRAAIGLEADFDGELGGMLAALIAAPGTVMVAGDQRAGAPAFLVSVPILTARGARAGTLVVGDHRNRTALTADERTSLDDIAALAGVCLETVEAEHPHFRLIFERAPDAIGVSRGGVHIVANDAYCRLFACPSIADLIGRPILNVIAPEERPRVQQLNAAREQGRPVPDRYETRGLRFDGTVFDMEVHVSRYEIEGAQYTLVSLNDVSERTQGGEQLRRANETLRALVQASPVAIVASDREGRTTLWNTMAEKLFGWPEQEVLGAPVPFVPASAAEETEMIRKLTLEGIGVSNVEVQRRRRDAGTIDVSVSMAPIHDWAGAVIGVMAVYVDISERKRMEQRLADAQKMEAVGRLAGGIAHDFNNLLTIITGYTQMMLDLSPEDDPNRESTQEILLAAQRAAKLTNQLLAFSRRHVLQMQPVSLAEQVSGMENLLRRTLGEHIELRTWIAPDVPLVSANPGQIEQVIMNLALNARDAMPAGGTLTIEVAPAPAQEVQAWESSDVVPGLYAMLAVHDSGHGIDRDTLARIFEPFFTTKEPGKGTGLGLATVYGIVKQHRGYVGVDSAADSGTVFRVYLPAVRASRHTVVSEPATMPARGHETVLVVEDEPSLNRLVSGMLASEGYTVLSADTVEQAQALATSHEGAIHLLLSDVVMPGMGGPELARKVTALRPGMRVAFMSGYMNHAVSREILADHGWFLEKPFTKAALLRLVREALDRTD